jgi:adenylate kinase
LQIKDNSFHAGKDAAFDSLIFDEASQDKLLDEMEPLIAKGGVLVDFHTCDFFPERFFDLVLVLRASNTLIFDRLTLR